jgi:hypothetical protein
VFAQTAAQRAEEISINMLSDRVVRISDIPNADQREYLKNMLTDRVVRISDTLIAGQRKYLTIC